MSATQADDRLAKRWVDFARASAVPETIIVLGPPASIAGAMVEELSRQFAGAGHCVAIDPLELLVSDIEFLSSRADEARANAIAERASQSMTRIVNLAIERKNNLILRLYPTDPGEVMRMIKLLREAGGEVQVLACAESSAGATEEMKRLESQFKQAVGCDYPLAEKATVQGAAQYGPLMIQIEREGDIEILCVVSANAKVLLRATRETGFTPGDAAAALGQRVSNAQPAAELPRDAPRQEPAPIPPAPNSKVVDAGGRRFRMMTPATPKPDPAPPISAPTATAPAPVTPTASAPAKSPGGFRLVLPPASPKPAAIPPANAAAPPPLKSAPPPPNSVQAPQPQPPSAIPISSAAEIRPAPAPIQDPTIRYAQLTPEQRRAVDRRKRQQARIRKMADQ